MKRAIYLTRKQVREVDRRAIEEYGIPGIVLMENAARGAAEVALSMLRESGGKQALILCGGGNNGGDGLAVARHLHNAGVDVAIGLCVDPAGYKGDALINWNIVQRMGLICANATADSIAGTKAAIIIDSIFGTGLSTAPRPGFDAIADAVNQSGKEILAIDLPSGMDCDTGRPLGACVRAVRTVTFVAEKAGFIEPEAVGFTGRVSVVDIGCPPAIVRGILADS